MSMLHALATYLAEVGEVLALDSGNFSSKLAKIRRSVEVLAKVSRLAEVLANASGSACKR